MWSNVVMRQQKPPANGQTPSVSGLEPGGRYKHAIALSTDDLYLYGGKSGHSALKDFWKLQLRGGSWTQIQPNSSKKSNLPPQLQEHSLVSSNGCLYLFGGQIGLSDPSSVPMWIYNIKNNEWRKWESGDGPKSTPAGGRRGHVAAVHSTHMLIHGGYRDLHGSLGDLWAFHFETESWHLFHCHTTPTWYSSNNCGPPPRHNHGGISHAGSLYIIGGMCNLEEKNDFWKYEINSSRWTQIKAKPQPGPLKSPSVSKALGSLFVFGGERNGKEVDEFWRFSFDLEVWERIVIHGVTKPSPRLSPSVVMLPALIKIKNGSIDGINSKGSGKYYDDDERSSSPNNYWWDYGPKSTSSTGNGQLSSSDSSCIIIDPGVTNYQVVESHVTQCGIIEYEHGRAIDSGQYGQPRRSESAHCVTVNSVQQNSFNEKCRVKKSNSVRFHDQTTTMGSSRLPTSDYSSMETIGEQRVGINGFENPNYRLSTSADSRHSTRGRGNRVSPRGGGGFVGDLIEMDEFGEDQQLLLNNPHLQQQQQYEITTPNYLLMIGGLESGFSCSQLSSKKPLSIWRLRVSPELFNN